MYLVIDFFLNSNYPSLGGNNSGDSSSCEDKSEYMNVSNKYLSFLRTKKSDSLSDLKYPPQAPPAPPLPQTTTVQPALPTQAPVVYEQIDRSPPVPKSSPPALRQSDLCPAVNAKHPTKAR